MSAKTSVLMVCLGNICRSPTAEGVFRAIVEKHAVSERFRIDSAGTSDWHVGESPDARSVRAAEKRGYSLEGLKGRQVTLQDFEDFDYILAMDKNNYLALKRLCPPEYQHKISLLLAHGNAERLEVPDPYYSGADGFELVLDLLEEACEGFLLKVLQEK